jgi:hypothetical protein
MHKGFAAIAIVTLCFGAAAAQAQSVDLDAATVADLNTAFAQGTLTSEKLVQMSLARIDAFDRKGPALRAVITLNPRARALSSLLPEGRQRCFRNLRDDVDVGIDEFGDVVLQHRTEE